MATMIKQKNIFGSAARFLSEVWVELKKVQWPSKDEMYGFTVMVIVAIIAVGFYLGLMDYIMVKITDPVFRLGGTK